MSRVIKFRAWDASEKEMVCWPSLYNDPDDWFISLLEGDEPDDVLMQFTGLTDKYGKEIWEGDLVQNEFAKKNGAKPYIVVYQAPSFVMKQSKKAKFWATFDLAETSRQFEEVIGNIYENPDLLK